LYDYPEPQRSQILDLLFKPRFGAGFQHLKVEIGGGENSTCGSEPSHAVTKAELAKPRARGFEFWLMSEARRRNPGMILDCLPWSFPGWLSGKFTQDSADWFVAFLDVARLQYGLDLDWVSAAENENGTNLEWIASVLRPALDHAGYAKIRIQAPDDAQKHWQIFSDFASNPVFQNVVSAVGYHYVSGRKPWTVDIEGTGRATDLAVRSGKPLWASEEWSTGGGKWDPAGALYVAQLINKVYIRDHITKTELWAPVDSLYDGLPWHDSGVMRADSPWSGHFEIWPAVWAVAHTTHFAKPGWRYLDEASAQLKPGNWQGSYVTLRDEASGDWSMILTTGNEGADITISVASNLKRGPLEVWQSDESHQFIRQRPLDASKGTAKLRLVPKAIYTITTTTGARKGFYSSPQEKPFPLPYREDFEGHREGTTPRYFADQKGSFEVTNVPNRGKCLRQIVPVEGYRWKNMPNVAKPNTVFGDHRWKDYSISADVFIDAGDVEVGGRLVIQDKEAGKVEGGQLAYRLKLGRDGAWTLCYRARTLAAGVARDFLKSRWHNLSLVFVGERISAILDGALLGEVSDASATAGMAFLASTYDANLFDNVQILP